MKKMFYACNAITGATIPVVTVYGNNYSANYRGAMEDLFGYNKNLADVTLYISDESFNTYPYEYQNIIGCSGGSTPSYPAQNGTLHLPPGTTWYEPSFFWELVSYNNWTIVEDAPPLPAL